MIFKRIIATTCIASIMFVSSAFATSAPPTLHGLNCVATGVNPKISATVPSTLTSPRVFFRANGERTEYYVDMHRTSAGSNDWFAILPPLEPTTKTITYRVAGIDENKQWVVSAPVTVSAIKSCPATLTADEQKLASGIVLGLTVAGQTDVPPGFSCRGIANVIGVDCQMRPADGCRRLLAQGLTGVPAAGAAATGALAATGLSGPALAALGLAGLVGGIAVYNNTHNNNNPVSPSRP